MNYAAALDYLYAKLPMFQRIGKAAFKKDLTNTLALLDALGNPHLRLHTVHVAGTNGKGSVSSMLASVLKEAGYKTGLYTSPHLKSFTERIRINGNELPEAYVVDFVERMRDSIEAINPSFFEVTVAMCFDFFAQQQVDIAVIEVGLGGRLDSTNVILPEVCVITNIDYDHMDLLGNTLGEIAAEKAGIIKPEVPVVVGQRHPETDPVFEMIANDLDAPVLWAADLLPGAQVAAADAHHLQAIRAGAEVYQTDLAGSYQVHNLPTAVAAVQVLRGLGWQISDAALAAGLAHVRQNAGLRGRFERLSENPLTICDTGHNEAGIRAVMSQLLPLYEAKKQAAPTAKLRMVLGMVSDKDHGRVLRLLPADAVYYFVRPDVPRGLDAAELSAKAAEFGLHGTVCGTVADGLARANAESHENDVIFVGGSTFVVAEAL